VWLLLYAALSLGGLFLLGDRVSRIVIGGGAMVLSLLALAWPVLRGQTWHQVRREVGLTLGEQPLLEPSIGVLSYFMSLPFVLVGLVLWAPFLFRLAATPTRAGDPFAPDISVAHPIIEQFAHGSLKDWVPVFFLGCVVAPIVEEIMFRGVLYRHVRDATHRSGAVSVVVSALLVNMLFAVVHPQGLLAAPLLASLACGFVLAREWRGTLLPGILAHAINNTVMFTVIVGLTQ
jgi:membrane protease YdiL (CAAX protease family)